MENENQATVTTADNSSNEANLESEISKALEEPDVADNGNDTVIEETVKEPQKKDNVQIECPEKFKNEDGSTNLEKVLKSYKELEPLINEKAQWEKERADLLKAKEELDNIYNQKELQAKSNGYDSVLDMEQEYELANLEANEYAAYLQYTDNPQEVQKMLQDYIQNPSQELLDSIESEFPSSVIKQVATLKERKRSVFENQKREIQSTRTMTNIENIISQSVSENKELFNYEPFKKMFVNALDRYGENFSMDDAKELINTMNQMKELYLEEFQKQNGINIENNKATDKLAGITNTNSAPSANFNPNLDGLSEKELAKIISKYI